MIRLPSRRSVTSSAALRMLKCRDTAGAEIENLDAISPAGSSLSRSDCRISRRVGSVSARKIRATSFIADLLNKIAKYVNTNRSRRRSVLVSDVVELEPVSNRAELDRAWEWVTIGRPTTE